MFDRVSNLDRSSEFFLNMCTRCLARPIVLAKIKPPADNDSVILDERSATRSCWSCIILSRIFATRWLTNTSRGIIKIETIAIRQSKSNMAIVVVIIAVTCLAKSVAVFVSKDCIFEMSLVIRACISPVRVDEKNESDKD
ncbi:hypothetical protein D3C81_1354930 [compost metagenome]